MKLVWSPEALDDLLSIRDFISQQDPRAGIEVVTTIVSIAEEQLSRFPEIGREGRVERTRELVVPGLPFVLPYRVTSRAIEIARVYHASRKWPDRF